MRITWKEAAILEAFLSFWEKNNLDPELDHHITMLTKNLIENREGGKGWHDKILHKSTFPLTRSQFCGNI